MATTTTARQQLRNLESILATARRWAIEEAKALLTIRDKRLYRATHDTFDQYVTERWQMDRTYAYRCCSWAEVIANVSPIGDIPLREAHARPLAGLPPDQQRAAWKRVLRRLGGSRTAVGIESVVATHLPVTDAATCPTMRYRPIGDHRHG